MSSFDALHASPDDLAAQARGLARKVGDRLSNHASDLRDSASSARYESEEFIRANPWPAVAIAAGIGFLFGVMAARR